MHFTTAVLALAATALAAPSSQTKRDGATCDALGQYSCSADGTKILQCDATLHLAVRALDGFDYFDRTLISSIGNRPMPNWHCLRVC